ncbi:MAG: DUF2203 domain-containing protein [Chlamydiota bacterium]|nr:DUF2203 domain-containing protein [Chlamydiota bacterium]
MAKDTNYFTIEEANKTLPLVKQIVEDILSTGQTLRELSTDLGPLARREPRAKKLLNRLNELMFELTDLGCSYKDWGFSMGLVDFPALIDGKEVLLCWRSDEDLVQYYHEPESGYQGRKPIPADDLS